MLEKVLIQFHSQKPLKYILLGELFIQDILLELFQEIKKLQFEQENEIIRHCYSVAELSSRMKEIITDKSMTDFLSQFGIQNLHWQVLQLSWKNYKVLLDSEESKIGQDVIIDITPYTWNDDAGGSLIYTFDDDYIEFGYLKGGCFILDRKKGTRRFFKYVNHYANNSSRILLVGSNCQIL